MTDPSLLSRVGEALYGSHWQTDLAKAVGVSDRTMRRWVAEPGSVPRGLYMDLLNLVVERQVVLDDLVELLKLHG